MILRPELEFPATIPGLLHHGAARWGDADMVVTETERLTYRVAEVASRRLAKRLLASGVGKGTRVGTHFPYGTQWLISWLAIERVGALHMPFSTAYKPAELRKSLALGDVDVLLSPRSLFDDDHEAFVEEAIEPLTDDGSSRLRLTHLPYLREVWFEGGTDRPWAREVSFAAAGDDTAVSDELLAAVEAKVTPADLAITIFTSGTTSDPKAVNHSHGALVRKGAHLAALLKWNAQDVVFCGMPFFWVGGIAMTVVPALCVGATLLCLDRTEPMRSLDLMEHERATRMTGWPGVRIPIATHPSRVGRDIPALEPRTDAAMSSLGMSESLASYTYPDYERADLEAHWGTVGFAIDGCELRIRDPDTGLELPEGQEGAIHIRGYFLMQGLYKKEREEVFTRDGFYNTGDKGFLLDDMLHFTGRLTEMIKTYGNNVAPLEVEAVFRTFPEVEDVHVLGVPDEARGEVVAAGVIARAGATIDPDEIRERARKELSNYKVPRYVIVLDAGDVPSLATGKPDRRRVRELLIAAKPA